MLYMSKNIRDAMLLDRLRDARYERDLADKALQKIKERYTKAVQNVYSLEIKLGSLEYPIKNNENTNRP